MELNIRRAKRLIQHQLEQPLGFPAIADRLNVNYHTLRKQFSRIEGVPMVKYHQQWRLEAAKKLLKNPEIAVFEIATATGFSANSNFARWFKQNTGLKPTDYRRQQLQKL